MGYEYKCPCGAEFNTPAISVLRKEAHDLYYRGCPFCCKTMMIADEGAESAKPAQKGDSLVRAVLGNDAPTVVPAVNPPRFHKRVYEARNNRKCPCHDCAEPDSPMMRRIKWMRGERK